MAWMVRYCFPYQIIWSISCSYSRITSVSWGYSVLFRTYWHPQHYTAYKKQFTFLDWINHICTSFFVQPGKLNLTNLVML
jgi:hypothetical protein